ncbi:MAG: high-potential iron-sulfur protein [Pseudomonadota bacterium]
MTAHPDTASRRRFLKLAGGTVALIPLVNLYGCTDPESGQQMQEPSDAPQQPAGGTQPTGEQPATEPQSQPQSQAQQPQGNGESLEKLEESATQASSLGYKHSADEVDAEAFPSYEEGQLCSNCSLFQPELGDDPWGGCQIFPGKLVNADGWCSAYVPA